jgi:hypothetical protein
MVTRRYGGDGLTICDWRLAIYDLFHSQLSICNLQSAICNPPPLGSGLEANCKFAIADLQFEIAQASPIHLSHHNVHARVDRDQIRQQVPLSHFGQRGEIDERRGSDPESHRLGSSI